LRTLFLAVLATTAVSATLAGAGSAETASELERQAEALRGENSTLAAGSQSAVQGLQAIEARLQRTRAELASFRARAAVVRDRRSAVNDELGVARASVRSSRDALARRLQALYEQGETDILEVLLGGGSLHGALEALEAFDQAARQDKVLLVRARSASTRLARLSRSLAARERELEQLAAVREAAAASLEEARAERLRRIAAMQAASRANSGRIADLEGRARALASAQSAAVPTEALVPGAPQIPSGIASGVHTLTVVATAYALSGTTASGRPVGWGAVAVDPSVIPMGSRLSVPGYGLGVAADTGSAIQGARIDLWFPSVEEARAWGSRMVTITVYS
jgi:3D (Asp-Asp-Asp) domain-containing protein/peptidoglycan hydrolase CwlO-like protein